MAKKKQQPKEAAVRRQRRSVDDQIASLAAKIAAIKDREARKQAKADPALRFVSAALRSIDKALGATSDAELRHSLLTTRSTLAPLIGGGSQNGQVRRSRGEIDNLGDSLLNYVVNNPGQRGEEIAAALATDAGTIRPVMKKLIASGKVKTEGQRRGMTYSPA
jgi:DNA-binding MarR family transcriptional regulator